MSARVCLVEDEEKLARIVGDYLQAAGHEPRIFGDGRVALDAARSAADAGEPFDVFLLDVMLPGLDGLSLLRALREFTRAPVILVTARVEEIDRILGLELGADDYVCKPFSPRELTARVGVQLRRLQSDAQDAPATRLRIAEEELRAWTDGRPVDLTPVEFRILCALASPTGRVHSRQQLMDAAYTDHRVVSDRTIDTHVKNLRRKLAEGLGQDAPIESVYGVGYRMDPL